VARSAEGARSAGPQGNHGGFLARFARAPSPPPAVLPRSAAAPRGRGVGRPCRWGPTKRLAEWGSGTKCRGGAVRRTAGKPRWFSGSLRSRPLPASGGTPPFRCRRGFLPHEAVSGVGEWHEVPRG